MAAKQTQQQQLDMLTQAVAALAASIAPASSDEPTAAPASKGNSKPTAAKAVKDENSGLAPTSKQCYILLMRARDNGLASFTMPTTRGAAADLIGAVMAAKTKAAAVKVLS
jgi:hypothetical protein